MAAVITPNNRASRDTRAPAPATHEDGSNYNWRMFYDSGRTIADADSMAELIELLLPAYGYMQTNEERLGARIAIAQGVQIQTRAGILADLTEEQEAGLADWEKAVLSWSGDGTLDPYGWGDGSGELGVKKEGADWVPDVWSSDIPLVLLSTSYDGDTGIQRPLSSHGDYREVPNLIWLRPESERSLLESLNRVGFIVFGEPEAVLKV